MGRRLSRGISSGVGSPRNIEGRNGDLSIRKTRQGKIFYIKADNEWHAINTGIDTIKLKKDVDRLLRGLDFLDNSFNSKNNIHPTYETIHLNKAGKAATIDPKIKFSIGGTDKFVMGVDDSDSDKFKIDAGTGTIGGATKLTMDSSGNVTTAGIVSATRVVLSSGETEIGGDSSAPIGAGDFGYTAGAGGFSAHGIGIVVDSYTTASGSDQASIITTLSKGTGDCYYRCFVGASAKWSFGNDTSDSHKFKIDTGIAITDTSVLGLGTAGDLSLFGTSASLKLSYDGSNYGVIDVASDGHVEIESVGTDADMTLNAAGSIELNADGGNIDFKDDGIPLFACQQGRLDVHYDANTYGRLQVDSVGVTTLAAVNDVAATADIILDAGGDITLDSGTGVFIAKNAATEFSVANSAYAGMILGYTTAGIDAADDSYTLTATMTVLDNDMKVKFVAPPSGVIEIFAQIYFDASRRSPVLGLSDQDRDAGYQAISFPNATDVTNEHLVTVPPLAGGDHMLNNWWVVTGLTPGTAYEWWFAAKTSAGIGGVLKWGGNVTNEYPPFIMKATALPAAVSDYAVYG